MGIITGSGPDPKAERLRAPPDKGSPPACASGATAAAAAADAVEVDPKGNEAAPKSALRENGDGGLGDSTLDDDDDDDEGAVPGASASPTPSQRRYLASVRAVT